MQVMRVVGSVRCFEVIARCRFVGGNIQVFAGFLREVHDLGVASESAAQFAG